MAERILVVEDEEDIRELLRYNLELEGFRVTLAASGEEALRILRVAPHDLVVLDLMLPGLDGFETCRLARADEKTRDLPIVILSARGEEGDIVRGLELGADDYVIKPVSRQVLVARVRAVLRRRKANVPDASRPVRADELEIDPARHEARLSGELLPLTASEFRILHLLASRRGTVFTRTQIVDAARGPDVAVTERSVDVHVTGLRRKLGARRDLVETVRGVGYRFPDGA